MRGILGWAAYLPAYRLDRSQIRAVAGAGGGSGQRVVAGYDEDTTTMAVAAARALLRAWPEAAPGALWLTTTAPAYLDKTNATAVHAALRLAGEVGAYDCLGSVRSAAAALSTGLTGSQPVLVTAADLRTGWPGGTEESSGADAAAALLVGPERDGLPVLAELLAEAGRSAEFLDRWRVPGEAVSRTWEERFGQTCYLPLGGEALQSALARAGLGPQEVDLLVVAGLHERACAAVAKASGVPAERVVDRFAAALGNPGAAQPGLLLAAALERAAPGQLVVLLVLADGAQCWVLRTTEALAGAPRPLSVAGQLAGGTAVPYGRYLAWRALLTPEPPRRPPPARPSASAAARGGAWKFGLDGAHGLLAEQRGTVTTFTVDRLAYSPSPPVVFAVVDFDDGSRLPVELTDVDAAAVRVGLPVEMTFRRLFTADGIANYFWKARPAEGD